MVSHNFNFNFFMRISEQEFNLLRGIYLKHFSVEVPNELLGSYHFVIKNKEFIKSAKPEKRILNALLNIALEKIRLNKRYQKETLIRLIRSQVKPEIVDKEISQKLFTLFTNLILIVNEDLAWKLSVSLRDIVLADEHIFWLIDNYKRSKHIQNRLLRYPLKNMMISEWAIKIFAAQEIKDRDAELGALILNLDENFQLRDSATFLWAIHYSKLPIRIKKQLLWKNLSSENFPDFLKICDRNSYTDLIKRLYEKNSQPIFNEQPLL